LVKEIKEILAREKAKKDVELDDRISKLVGLCLKDLGDNTTLGDPSSTSIGKPISPDEEVFVDPTHGSGNIKPPESYNQFHFMYPKINLLVPHINNPGHSPNFDGTRFSYWITSMKSHLCNCSEELWDVLVRGFKSACICTGTMIGKSTQRSVTKF
jgi:hypothetical protein